MSIKFEKPSPPARGMIGPRVSHTAKILRCMFNQVANEEGLFSGQQHIILLLKHNEGLTVSQVAKAMGVATATTSVSIKRMEKAGFIVRKADENDARITKLFLTEKGKKAPENIKAKLDSQEKFITKGLTDDEINLLSDLLDKVIDNLKEWEEKDND